MLIEKGADVNAVNEDKNSALILAADNGNVKSKITERELYKFSLSFFQDSKKLQSY